MSHTVFQAAQVIPLPQTRTALPSKPLLPAVFRPVHARNSRTRKCRLTVNASSSAVVDDEAVAGLERCFQAPDAEASWVNSGLIIEMKGKGKSKGPGDSREKGIGRSAAAVMEKQKAKTVLQPKQKDPELATGGGDGGLGKGLGHGGGDGGDDGGDDDDYFDDFDEDEGGEEGGLFRRRMIFAEIFDRKFVDAVLNEWHKTIMDLPAGFRQAYEMGLVSSAQMVSFLSMNARPTTARFFSRSLPQGLSRAFIGRMIADPAFLYKMLLEQVTTFGCATLWEIKNRKERIKQEWDLALINVLTVTACNAVVVWSLAPCRSYGNTFQFDLQNTLQKLPNNIFEKSYPAREFDFSKRLQSFFYKAAELCMVGFTAGTVQGAASNFLGSKKEQRLSVTIPSVNTNALGYGAFLGIYANLRYQLLCGLERSVTGYFDVIGVALVLSTALRALNVQVGETSRLAWLGVEADPFLQSSDLMNAAYSRPSEGVDTSSSKSKNPIASGLGLLGIKQRQADSNVEGEAPAPKARRKKIVRRKVVTTR